MNDKCLIIAEAGVNHNGDIDLAFKLCDAAKSAGADVVKFQTWITEEIITRDVGQADYQAQNTGIAESQYDMLKKLELSQDDFIKIKRHCDDIGITFASTADDECSLNFLVNLGIPFIKVGSGDIGNVHYLRQIGAKGLPIILSTGMSSLQDVELSLDAIKEGGAEEITLLHCTTNYPCPYDQVNLMAMQTLCREFGLTIGYSDHTLGIEVAVAAVSMGAKVIEKHFTLDRNMEGPDHLASTEPDEFRRMVDAIRNVEKSFGDGIKQPTDSEITVKKVVTKRIVAKKDIKTGEVFSEANICAKRSNTGALAKEWDDVVGKRAGKDYIVDEGIVIL
ncbi:N-acetylneuraminate synthase [Butyrivibrio sp. AE2032]|uniref:N-acetylneuraminate synthase n=1 Tax=Butyrivibrio sp. AE2032 TaxID=1458463 RepID=UPI000555C6D1|nr:N-acetylneuraminate synthase [Butyrivibrio sp. AE2032]